jgi:GTPase SAR1 family protein
VYDVTNVESFNELHQFREQILRVKDAEFVPMVLIGYLHPTQPLDNATLTHERNKIDDVGNRVVTTEMGRRQGEYWRCPFIETRFLISLYAVN